MPKHVHFQGDADSLLPAGSSSVQSAAAPLPRRRCCRPARVACVVVALLGAAVAVAGPLLIGSMIDSQFDAMMTIDSPDAVRFAGWSDTTVESDRELWMYVWNVTNPDEFLGGAKLAVEEHGPFVYTKQMVKLDPTWDADADTVTYRLWTRTTFNASRTRELTNGTYDADNTTVFTTVDLLNWGALPRTGPSGWLLLNLKKPEREKMFNFSTTARALKNGYCDNPLLCFPGLFPDQPTEADAPNGTYTVRVRGGDDRSQVAQYTRWSGGSWCPACTAEASELHVQCPWGNAPIDADADADAVTATMPGYCPGGDGPDADPCCGGSTDIWREAGWHNGSTPPSIDVDAAPPNTVMGTDGNQFARGNLSTIVLFVDQLVRHVVFELVPAALSNKGIALSRYELPLYQPANLNASRFPYNANYYMYDTYNAMQNATIVQQGAPVYFTHPHFLGAEDAAAQRIDGIRPDPERHQVYLGIESTSGLNCLSRNRLQVNVQVHPVKFTRQQTKLPFEWFKHIMPGETYAPIAWFDDRGDINEASAARLRGGLQLSSLGYVGTLVGGATVSGIALVAALFLR